MEILVIIYEREDVLLKLAQVFSSSKHGILARGFAPAFNHLHGDLLDTPYEDVPDLTAGYTPTTYSPISQLFDLPCNFEIARVHDVHQRRLVFYALPPE